MVQRKMTKLDRERERTSAKSFKNFYYFTILNWYTIEDSSFKCLSAGLEQCWRVVEIWLYTIYHNNIPVLYTCIIYLYNIPV